MRGSGGVRPAGRLLRLLFCPRSFAQGREGDGHFIAVRTPDLPAQQPVVLGVCATLSPPLRAAVFSAGSVSWPTDLWRSRRRRSQRAAWLWARCSRLKGTSEPWEPCDAETGGRLTRGRFMGAPASRALRCAWGYTTTTNTTTTTTTPSTTITTRAHTTPRRVDLTLRSRKVGPSLGSLEEGQVVRGRVKRLAKFGVFVELEGKEAEGATGGRRRYLKARPVLVAAPALCRGAHCPHVGAAKAG